MTDANEKLDEAKANNDDEIKINGNGKYHNDDKRYHGIHEKGDEDLYGDDLYEENDDNAASLHGYDKMSPGCGNNIQLENPDKKELLVCLFCYILVVETN